MASGYKLLGEGSYGAVISPALPNIDACGNPITFDNYVTKLMFDIDAYEGALESITRMKSKVPSIALNIQPYRRTITSANIANIPGLQEYIASDHPDYTDIYAFRMPYLGHSLYDIRLDKTAGPTNLCRRLQEEWSSEDICRQILKLMYILRDIKDAGFVHGDVREPNIMCNLDTKEFTLVDFDWFMKRNEFQVLFPSYGYAYPPEGILVLSTIMVDVPGFIQKLFITKEKKFEPLPEPEFDERWNKNVDLFVKKFESRIEYFVSLKMHPHIDTVDKFVVQLRSLGDYFKGLIYYFYNDAKTKSNTTNAEAKDYAVRSTLRHIEKRYFDSLDSYGLAISLYEVMDKTLVLPHHQVLRKFLFEELFPLMTAFHQNKRVSINGAIAAFHSFLSKQMPTLKADFDMEDELKRLRAINPDVIRVPMPRQRRLSSARRSEERKLRQQVEAYAALVGALENMSVPRKTATNKKKSSSSSNKRSANRSTRKKSPK